MIKHLVFAARIPYLPAWGKVNIHTTLGIIPAEYVPNSEIQIESGAYAYDFYILEGDIPTPGDFTCDQLVDPFVTPFASNANCGPSCFKGLETVNSGGIQFVAAFVDGQCGGTSCLVKIPIGDLCQCEDGDPPDLEGYALLEGGNAFVGSQSITGNLSLTGNFSITGLSAFGGVVTFTKQIKHSVVTLTNSDGTVAWNLANGNYGDLILAEPGTLANPTNVGAGTYIVRIEQANGGGQTLAFGSNFRFPGGIPPVLSTAEGAVDILTFVNFGDSDLHLIEQLDFQPDTP
jgi:hypothetical protein